MQEADPPQGKRWNVVFSLTALLIIAADQLSKIWIRSTLVLGKSLPETGLFRLTRIHNTGAAFGLLQGQSFALSIVALVGVVAILVYVLFFWRRFTFSDKGLSNPSLGLILGGTVGNLVDRLSLGYITDFIDIGIWPTFNIADSAIVIGVILFSYSLHSLDRAKKTDLST